MALAEGVKLKTPQSQAKMDMDQMISMLAAHPGVSEER